MIPLLQRNFIRSKAAKEFFLRPNNLYPFNGYEPASEEFFIYQEKIEELKEKESGKNTLPESI